MFFGLFFLAMFMVPAAVLGWRVVVSKTRNRWLRVGGAVAVMATVVGAFVVFDQIVSFSFGNWRDLIALVAALSASAYLFVWSLRRRTNQRYRTISLIAAVVGIVPAIGAVAAALLFQE
ncbi:MAG TPA: hypothetical protein VIL42_07525 [Sphingomicrobium sp.]|jgi:hypothetical protein